MKKEWLLIVVNFTRALVEETSLSLLFGKLEVILV